MTEEYKNILLRYLSGNLNFTPINNTPQFEEPIIESSTLYNYITTNAGAGFSIIDIIQGYNSNNYVLYGNDANNKGFIIIINESLIPIQYIDSFSSGTDFGQFIKLRVDEDGKFYGVDKTTGYRFIMLNNIVVKSPIQQEYSVKLRQSYMIPSPLSTADDIYDIAKANGQAKYLFGATANGNPLFTELTINVGMPNEWVDYETTALETFKGQSLWATWEDDTLNFKASGLTYTVQGDNGYIGYWEFKKNGNSLSSKTLFIEQVIENIERERFDANTVILNENISYIAILDGGEYGTEETLTLYEINTTTEEITELKKYGEYETNEFILDAPRTIFKVLNGRVYFLGKVRDAYNPETGTMTAENTHIFSGLIIGNEVNQSSVVVNSSSFTLFLISNVYNLYNYNVFSGNTKIITQQVFNPANYNGIPYENINSLISNSGIVYNNNKIVFARNLYNKTIYNNTVLSSIQVPNMLINDIELTSQLLCGETKKILVENEESFTKNIYETLFFNFYNTLLIEDQNKTPYVQNIQASYVLNNSVSIVGDYLDKRAIKYKIVYTDNTYTVGTSTTTLSGSGSNYKATFHMTVVLSHIKEPLELEIISDDETTVYQTIDISNLTPGKIYNITQDCYIE